MSADDGVLASALTAVFLDAQLELLADVVTAVTGDDPARMRDLPSFQSLAEAVLGFRLAVDASPERDALEAQMANAECDLADRAVELLEARAALDALHTWPGLMRLLDEHWPEDVFPTLEDDESRDAGARIVSLLRWVERRSATSWTYASEEVIAEARVRGDLDDRTVLALSAHLARLGRGHESNQAREARLA